MSIEDHAPPAPDELFQTLFEFAPDAILLVDAAGVIVHANAQVEALFGHSREELTGKPIELLVPERFRDVHPSHRETFAAKPRTRRMGEGLELFARRRDGTEFPVEIALAPVKSPGGRYVLSIVRDVTSRKVAEMELRRAHDDLERRVAERTAELEEAGRRLVQEQAKLVQAEKLSSIGLLASGVAHEINNPLSGVMGLVKALEDDRLSQAERSEFFDAVRDGLERMRMTVQGLLNFARQQPPSPEPLDAADVCAACIRLVGPAARKKRVDLRLGIEPERAFVRADRSQLMQAVVNVLMNAIHAAPDGSAIDVESVPEGRLVGIRIRDRGPGIPRAILSKVCDPFFTTKSEGEGTGLGLAVTLSILRGHGGDLAIDSEPGAGTAVTMWLPAPEGGTGDA